MEACRDCADIIERVVVASSDKAYGPHARLPYTEDAPLQGIYPYDVSKSCADLIALSYYHSYDSPVCVTRCGNLYGGGDLNFNRIVPGTVRSALRGEPPVIRSDGAYVRDYFYVADAVAAYLHLAERLPDDACIGQGFNFGNEEPLSVIEIVDLILEHSGRTDLRPVILDEATSEIRKQYLDCSKARSVLGWKPLYALEDGLRQTIKWYAEWLDTA
jgi:CDP-glucose 4,6-dehydratase